ncbi:MULTISPECIES: GIY-YIG nuclease family protein [unclassified Luteimonas]
MSAWANTWWLYLLECGDGSWYAGISNDLDARLRAHAAGKGARYTRGRAPLRLIASRVYPDRATASRAEWQLKQLPKARKLAFFEVEADVEADVEVDVGVEAGTIPNC